MNKARNGKKPKQMRPKNRRRTRSTHPGLPANYYKETVRIYNYKWNISESTEVPLILRFGAMVIASARVLSLCTNFQQYKVVGCRVVIAPEFTSGNSPTPIYLLASMDREVSLTNNMVVECGKMIPTNRLISKFFLVKGRQNDFDYWFDCANIGTADKRPTFQFNFGLDELAGKYGKYVITIESTFIFRFPQYAQPPISKKEEEEKIEEEKDEDKEEEKEINEEIKKLEDKIEELKIKKSYQ